MSQSNATTVQQITSLQTAGNAAGTQLFQLPNGQTVQLANNQQLIALPAGVQIPGLQAANTQSGQPIIIQQATAQHEELTNQQQISAANPPHLVQTPEGQIIQLQADGSLSQQNIIQIPTGLMVSGGGPTASATAANQPLQRATLPPPENMLEEEPLYVNAKQYNRILKRRQARAKLEADGKIPKERSKYLHESRHLHALKRVRSSGGKFGSPEKVAEENAAASVGNSILDAESGQTFRIVSGVKHLKTCPPVTIAPTPITTKSL